MQLIAGAVVNAATTLGEGVIVNTNASVDHDCTIGDYVHVAPGAVLGGGVTVGDDVLIGLGARVLPGVTIGARGDRRWRCGGDSRRGCRLDRGGRAGPPDRAWSRAMSSADRFRRVVDVVAAVSGLVRHVAAAARRRGRPRGCREAEA